MSSGTTIPAADQVEMLRLREEGATYATLARRFGYGAMEIESFILAEKRRATQERYTPHWVMRGTSDFARNLRAYRERANLRQADVAARAGLDHSAISLLESDRRQPRRDTILAICDALPMSEEETDNLLISAGYLPVGHVYDHPVIQDLRRLMADVRISDARKTHAMALVEAAISHARREMM